MKLVELFIVTIVSERILREEIIELIKKEGSKGHTITDATGEGSRGTRVSDFEGKNVKIETVVSREVGNRIIDEISSAYFENYAVIVYAHPVKVVRGNKYI